VSSLLLHKSWLAPITGPLPPASYQDQIKDYMVGVLKDPMSAQYIFEEPKKGWMHDAPIAGGKIHYTWEVKTKINGKNGFGGYVGFQSYSFWFKNGKIISATNASGLGFDRNGNLSVTSE